MKRIEIIKILEEYPIFTSNEFIRIIGKPPEYANTYLYRLKKEGLVFRVERGKYTTHDDPMIFSSHVLVPSYISFWTALRFYNLTEQLPRDVMIASPRPKRTIEFHGTEIRFFKLKHFWGYRKEKYMGFDIFVAEKEKCIIDCMLLKNVPFDEIAKAMGKKELDQEKLMEYAIKAKNISLLKRLGYLAENLGLQTEGLVGRLDNNYVLLDWSRKKKGEKNKKWKIIVNRRLDDIY